MLTFTHFLHESAGNGEAVNTLFEERLFDLVGVLHRIADSLSSDQIPYEVVGGLAVLIHVEEASPEHAALTRDVDLMVRRADLERIKSAAAADGFRFRHVAGVDMLVYGDTPSVKNAVRLLFSEERIRADYPADPPAIAPERKRIHGREVMVIPVGGLLAMS